MSNIDKQALRGQSVEGSYYLAECGYCGQFMPSSKLRVLHSPDGEADFYCPHCNAQDCEIFDLGTVGSEVVNAWNYQQKRIEALLDELEASEKLNAELMEKQRLIDICQGQGLEHRIAAEKRAEAAEKRIAELERKEQHSERQSVIDALAGSGEEWSDIEEYMQKWDAERAYAAGKGE